MTFVNVPMKEIAKDATPKERAQAFYEHCEEHVRVNPGTMLPLGVKKRWWHVFKTEHPFTTAYKDKLHLART